jgi:hypothetical protein
MLLTCRLIQTLILMKNLLKSGLWCGDQRIDPSYSITHGSSSLDNTVVLFLLGFHYLTWPKGPCELLPSLGVRRRRRPSYVVNCFKDLLL